MDRKLTKEEMERIRDSAHPMGRFISMFPHSNADSDVDANAAMKQLCNAGLSLESVRSEARNAALEEAAKVCECEAEAHRSADNHKMRTPAGRQGAIAQEVEARNCATLIRALSPARVAEQKDVHSTELRK